MRRGDATRGLRFRDVAATLREDTLPERSEQIDP